MRGNMKKLLLISFLFVFSSPLFAKDPSLSEVLAWKYGYVASTCQADQRDKSENPKMVICGWKGVDPQPDETQIAQDTIDYKAFLIADKAAKEAARDAVLVKLKITKQEFDKLNAKI